MRISEAGNAEVKLISQNVVTALLARADLSQQVAWDQDRDIPTTSNPFSKVWHISSHKPTVWSSSANSP